MIAFATSFPGSLSEEGTWERGQSLNCFVLPCCYTRASRNDGRPKLKEELNIFILGQVIHRADNVVHRINHYPAESVVCSASTGQRFVRWRALSTHLNNQARGRTRQLLAFDCLLQKIVQGKYALISRSSLYSSKDHSRKESQNARETISRIRIIWG